MIRTRLAAAVLCLAAIGCSGESGTTGTQPTASGSPTASAMSKEQFVAAANEVCKGVNTQAESITEPKTAADYATATEQLLKIIDDAQRELRTLRPPADAQADWAKFLDGNDQQAQMLREALPKIQQAGQQNDKEAAEREFLAVFMKFDEAGQATSEWAKGYGLTECS